jgi:DNA-directed RNA polymerase specialized sigma24 family protein
MSSIGNDHQAARGASAHPTPPAHRLAGDESRLFIAYANPLRRTFGRIVNTSDANLDDACGFAWAQLISHQPRRETVLPWLVKVAVREAIRMDRRDRRTESIDEEVAPQSAAAATTPEDRLLTLEIIDALDDIHARRRRMLLMNAVGFTSDEIAAEHGINASRARAPIYKARLQLRATTGDSDRSDA